MLHSKRRAFSDGTYSLKNASRTLIFTVVKTTNDSIFTFKSAKFQMKPKQTTDHTFTVDLTPGLPTFFFGLKTHCGDCNTNYRTYTKPDFWNRSFIEWHSVLKKNPDIRIFLKFIASLVFTQRKRTKVGQSFFSPTNTFKAFFFIPSVNNSWIPFWISFLSCLKRINGWFYFRRFECIINGLTVSLTNVAILLNVFKLLY